MNSLLLKNILLDGERRDILVEGNRIRRIADDIAHPADRVLDGGGRLAAVPPFFNVHTHAAMTLLRGYADDMELFTWLNDYIWPAEARLTPEDIYHGTRLAILEMIRTGTVFFSDMYWHQKEAIRAAVEMGVRAAIGLLYIAGPDGRLLERNRRANAELLELVPARPARITISQAPPSPSPMRRTRSTRCRNRCCAKSPRRRPRTGGGSTSTPRKPPAKSRSAAPPTAG